MRARHVAQRGREVRERVRELQQHAALERRVVDDERAAVADRRDQRLGERAARIVARPCRGRAAVRQRSVGVLPVARPLHRDLLVRARALPQRHGRAHGLEVDVVARPRERVELRDGRGVQLGRAVARRAPDPLVVAARTAGRPERRAGRRIPRCATGARACRHWAAGRSGTPRSPARRTRGTRIRTGRCIAARSAMSGMGPARSRCAAAIHSGICSCSGTTASVRSASAKRPR